MKNLQIVRFHRDVYGAARTREALRCAAEQVPDIDAVGKYIVPKVPGLGFESWRELAASLCAWATDNGVIDDVFPIENIVDDA